MEATGLLGKLGKLKKLWGGKPATTTVTVKRHVQVGVPPAATMNHEKPVAKILDGITKKYQAKALPKLPVMVSRPKEYLWSDPKRRSLRKRTTKLWPAAEDVKVAVFDTPTRGNRARVRDDSMPAFKSTSLWTATDGRLHGFSMQTKGKGLWSHAAIPTRAGILAVVGVEPQQTVHVHPIANSAVVRRSKRIVIANTHQQQQQQNVRGQQQQRFVVQVGGRVFSSAALAVPPVPPARSSSPHASPAVVPQAIATKPSLPQPHTRSPDYSAPIALPPPVVTDESKHSRRYLWPSTVANTDTDTDTATTTTTTEPSSTNNSMDQQQAALWTLTSSNKAFVVTASTPAAPSSRPKPAPISAEPLRADGSLWTLSGDGSQPKKPQLWQPLSVSLKGLWRDATSFAGHAEERNHGQKLLWSQKEAKRTTDAIPERIRKAVTPDIKPVIKVGGGLWNAQTRHVDGDNADVVPKVDEQLWTASASPRLEPSTVPTSPLSTRETRQHMTTSATSTPERFISTLSTMAIDLPKATGNLWENRSVSVKKGKVIVSGSLLGLPEPEQAWRPTLRKSKSSLTVRPVEAVPEVEKIEVKVAGRLWNAPAPKPDLPAVPTFPLWTKETAQRTTAAKPERVVPAPRKMSIDLPKATGSLWDHRNVAVKKGKVVVSNSLWNLAEPVHAPVLRHSKSRRTLVAVPKTDAEKEKVVEVKVGGRLWTAPIPKVITPLPKETPLWTPATASRTTTAAPERGVKAVQKMSVDLPKATGSLWNMPQLQQDIVVKKGRVVVSGGLWNHQEKPAQRPALRKSKSSLTVLAMEKKEVDEEEVEKIEVKVAGRLWTATTSQSPPSRVVAADAPLWTKETALRTTTAMPERSIVVPRKMSLDLPKVTGPLWDNRYVVIKKGKIVVSTNCRTESSLQPPVLKRTKSSRTLIMERKDEEAEEVEKIEIKVVGRLLVAELPELPAPKEEIPVWIPAKEAPRTTDAIPVRLTAPTPKKVSSELPRATGSLWTGRDVVVKKGKVVVSTNLMNHAEALQPPPLQRSKSSITVIPVEKYETVKEVEIKVAGRLWTARAPSPPPPPATTLEAPLWTKDAAKRTTTAMPERVVTAPRKISVNLPKATGPLWDSRDVVVKKGKVVVGSSNLWSLQPPVQQAPTLRKSKSRVTLIAVEKAEAPETGKVEVKVAGRLWSATIPSTPTLPSTPMSPLWNKETAERTTTATPSGIAVSAPKKVATDVPLPKATGPLWGPDRQIVIKKSKVVISKDLWDHQQPAESPVLRKSKSSRTLIAVLNDDEEHRNELSVKVGGRLLTARTPSPPPAPLWTPSTPAVVAEPEPSYTWSKHTAARTTSQPPVRGVVLKKARNNHSGTMATGSLWGNQQSPPVLRKSRSPRTLIAIPDDNSEPKHTEQQQQFSLKIGRRVVTALPVEPSTLWTPAGAPPTEAIPGLSRTSTISSSDSSDVREGDDEVEMVVRRMKSGHGTLWTPNGDNDDVVVGKVTGSETKKRVVVGGR